MSGDEIAQLSAQMQSFRQSIEARVTALETARASDVAGLPAVVVRILKAEMPALVRDNVRSVIHEERIVSDAQRFRELLSLGRKVGVAVLVTVAGALAVALLNGWLLA